jgi:tRNA A-37 threonylcarbamoyl transferase component Bud32
VSTLEDGRSVGRYRIIRFLGAGAMGEVYLAEDPHIERKLAIKTVRLEGGRPQDIEDRKRRLLREARAAGRLLHPNVVTLFDTGEHEGLLYLAFEFVEGQDLASRIEEGPPPSLREVLRIIGQVADALDYAHRQGIVHRDIKPSNILLDTTGKVKVADFGIAKVAGQNTELTVVGSVMGSPQYLSPEQIRGEELDGRSDIFSLGVVLYELLSGRRPFDGETITTLVYQILHKDPSISELRTIPLRLEQLLHHMLAKDREERIATAEMVAEELAAIGRELPEAVLAAPAAAVTQELDSTRVIPSRAMPASPAAAGTAPAVQGQPAAPQPLAAAPSVGTLPYTGAAAGVTPPGAPTAPSEAQAVSKPGGTQPGAVDPRGMPGVPASHLQPAVAAAGAAPVAARRRGAGVWIGVAAILLFCAVAFVGAGYWAWLHYVQPALATRQAASDRESAPAPAPAPPPATATPPVPIPAAATPPGSPGASPGATATSPPPPSSPVQTTVANPPVRPGAAIAPPSSAPAAAPQTPGGGARRTQQTIAGSAAAGGTAVQTRQSPATVEGTPVRRNRGTPVAPAVPAGGAPGSSPGAGARNKGSSGSVPAISPDAEEPAAGGERETTPAAPAADKVIQSGLELAFRVSPSDAFVLLDGTLIGRADEWSGDRKARSYTLPGPGSYMLKIKRTGMKDYRVAVEATATRGVTQVTAQLQPLPAAQIETADLRTIRVRDAIALHVQPEAALVLVDGQTRGMARQFAGRFGRPGEWLALDPGKHRVTVTAPGYRREDIAVEVSAGADKDREKIDIVLKPGAGGE